MVAPAPASTAAMPSGTGWDAGGWLSGLEHPVASENHSPNRRAAFRMLGERIVLHALLDLEMSDFFPFFRGDGLVNVSRHDFLKLCLPISVRQQEGFPFLVPDQWRIRK